MNESAESPPPLEFHVDCSSSSLHVARDAVRAEFSASDSAGLPRPSVNVFVSGPCHLSSPLSFDSRDSGKVTWQPASNATSNFLVTGGAPVASTSFTPVTDESVLAQLPAIARAAVRQLNLTALGFPPGPAPIAGRECRSYAEGLPQPHIGSMPGAFINSPTGLELFAAMGTGGAATPLVLARWPNNRWAPSNWSQVLHSSPPTVRTMGPDDVTLARSASWAQQFAEDPGSIFVHQYNRIGWADMHWRLEGLTKSNFTFGGCGNMSVGEHVLETGNYFYTYNVLAELDEPGEYYINRTSGMLYAWLPSDSAPNANGTLGWVSLSEAPVLDLNSVTGASWNSASFRYGRGAGVSCVNCTAVSFFDCQVSMVGLMGVNISDGQNVLMQNLSVSDVGNGGVYLYAGDRVTLTPANHSLVDSRVTDYNRYTHCYTPGVTLGGVGNRVIGTRIWNAPHNAFFLSGNEHKIEGCDVTAVTRIVKDSGAFYAGRDLTYRGNQILNTNWHDINSVYPGTPVLYLDDCASSVTVINNSFRNCSGPSAALEGGKGHRFINNYIHEDAGDVHAVGKGCSGALPYLSLVPWNTSAIWLSTYPELLPEIEQNSGAPWHLEFANNTRCSPRFNSSLSAPFVDMSAAEAAQYNGSIDEGFNACVGPAGIWVAPPVRGWNSWTAYGCSVTDADLRATADALVDRGLAKAGYVIVAPDDCWAKSRDSNGHILPDPIAFPSGMLAVADYVRSRGLTFGMYTAIGNLTCAHRPGSAGFEANDAASYASWGVTWLKLDNCDYPGWDPALLYNRWDDALAAQSYRIPLATKAVLNYSTALRVGASRRVGGDVSASWRDLLGLAYMAEPLFEQARAGNSALGQSSFWTDVELLQVGRGHFTDNETAAHFWLWAALHAPLMLSVPIADLSDAQVELLTNPEVLAVNDDVMGLQARRVALQVAVDTVTLPLIPEALACSTPALVAPGQRWEQTPALPPAPSSVFSLRLRTGSGPAAGLCLQRPTCTGTVLTVDECPTASSTACEGGAGALWQWGSNGTLVSLATSGGCVNVEPSLTVSGCHANAAPYQTLSYWPTTGQIAMAFNGSGALADYTGYAQCIDALPTTHVEVWASALANGDVLLLTLNPTNGTLPVEVTINSTVIADAIGRNRFSGVRALRDIGMRTDIAPPPSIVFSVSTPQHGARILRLTPS